MPTFRYAKLVRKKIPGFHIESGHTFVGQPLEGKALVNALITKLHEETDKIDNALSPDQLIEELADVQQIIDDLCAISGIAKEDMTAVIAKKAARKGVFLQGEYIETVTIPTDDDPWVAYCHNAPEKYSEIKNHE